jgi:ectoine hydroxylase-related dioxygenase (phytanoyl-CoA dioxygenase family)
MNETHTDEDGTELHVSEITAQAGDVFLCHPFLIHAASPNHSGVPRFMCNRTTPLRDRMNLQRPDGDYSPVEISIRKALSA